MNDTWIISERKILIQLKKKGERGKTFWKYPTE
jgi:hypothetical protein